MTDFHKGLNGDSTSFPSERGDFARGRFLRDLHGASFSKSEEKSKSGSGYEDPVFLYSTRTRGVPLSEYYKFIETARQQGLDPQQCRSPNGDKIIIVSVHVSKEWSELWKITHFENGVVEHEVSVVGHGGRKDIVNEAFENNRSEIDIARNDPNTTLVAMGKNPFD